MTLELSSEERSFLIETLQNEFGRLRSEIYHTEAADYKEELKRREAMLEAIIGRLDSASTPDSGA
jgi:hypothetical protein